METLSSQGVICFPSHTLRLLSKRRWWWQLLGGVCVCMYMCGMCAPVKRPCGSHRGQHPYDQLSFTLSFEKGFSWTQSSLTCWPLISEASPACAPCPRATDECDHAFFSCHCLVLDRVCSLCQPSPHYLDQAGSELTEICLPRPPKC